MPLPNTRIALLADIHGNHAALRAVLDFIEGRVDHYLFLGDLCGYYPFVRECLAMWPTAMIDGVRGNHDQVLLDVHDGIPLSQDYRRRYGSAIERALVRLSEDDVAHLRQLPARRTLDVFGVRLAMFHGAPWDPLDGRVYPDFDAWDRFADVDADVVILGHTHYSMQKRVHGRLIVNPGSVGQARDRRGQASCAVLDASTLQVEEYRISFDASELVADAVAHDADLPYLTQVLRPS